MRRGGTVTHQALGIPLLLEEHAHRRVRTQDSDEGIKPSEHPLKDGGRHKCQALDLARRAPRGSRGPEEGSYSWTRSRQNLPSLALSSRRRAR